jgi:hypothetical protein
MNEKTKPFDGVKMGGTKSREYKIGNKKLSKKLKNIKMFEEFLLESETEAPELEEGLFSKGAEDKKKDLEADFKKYQGPWEKKGYKISKDQYEEEMKKAEKDKYEGKWGVDQKDKTVIYRNADDIAWGVNVHSFGSGHNPS